METPTASTSITPRDAAATQRHLNALVERTKAQEFKSQREIACAYEVDAATVTRWKAHAIKLGLVTDSEWRLALLQADLARAAA